MAAARTALAVESRLVSTSWPTGMPRNELGRPSSEIRWFVLQLAGWLPFADERSLEDHARLRRATLRATW